MASEAPPVQPPAKQEIKDQDFTTPEGSTMREMLEGEIARAMEKRLSGDLAGATVTLKRALKYCKEVREHQQSRTAVDADDEKNRILSLNHIEQLEGVLERLVEEFK